MRKLTDYLRSSLALGLLAASLVQPVSTNAHPGRQDANGGHLDRTTREYHCHQTVPDCVLPGSADPQASVEVASFNIQFLGNPKNRDNEALVALMAGYDIVLVQELVAPPFPGTFPNGKAFKPDAEARAFFDAMIARGFEFVLSEEDTGTKDKIHVNSSATEWWVAFFKPEVVEAATDLPGGFLARDRSNNNNYERVPYAFPFRTIGAGNDFVLISVHLQPGSSAASTSRRQHEFDSIESWIDNHDAQEKDFYIVGDMNIEDCDELTEIIPTGFKSLNHTCIPTNTNVNGPKPYDHVLYPELIANEIEESANFRVINLIETMRVAWFEDFDQPYPGDSPYQHNAFRARYSDHHPIVFEIPANADDD